MPSTTAVSDVPVRACINDFHEWSDDHVYIGRGDERRGLARSIWHNPYRVRDHNSRSEVLDKFEKHVERDAQLKAQIKHL